MIALGVAFIIACSLYPIYLLVANPPFSRERLVLMVISMAAGMAMFGYMLAVRNTEPK